MTAAVEKLVHLREQRGSVRFTACGQRVTLVATVPATWTPDALAASVTCPKCQTHLTKIPS